MKVKHDDIEQICAYCEKAVLISESDMCVCRSVGAVKANDSCKKFSLDLLKLSPVPRKLPDDEDVFFDI
jgi:hypothetical protein